MVDEQKDWFEVVKHKSGLPPVVVATVRGLRVAQLKVESLDATLDAAERDEGWGHYQRPGSKPDGVELRKLRKHRTSSNARRRG